MGDAAMIDRVLARRAECAFVDRVNRREVWRFERNGRAWLGQSRFGVWVPTERAEEDRDE